MKTIRKITALSLVFVFVLSLAACAPKHELVWKWKYDLELKQVIEHTFETLLSSDDSKAEMYREVIKAFDGVSVDFIMEFKNDGTYSAYVDEESAKSAVAAVKAKATDLLPSFFSIMGSLDSILSSQGKTLKNLAEIFTKDININDLTAGSSLSGKYIHENDKIYLIMDGSEINENIYLTAAVDGDVMIIRDFSGTLDIFNNMKDSILPMKLNKV